MTYERWKKLMASFGFAENRAAFDLIIEHHSQKHRAYHNSEHVADCLDKLDLFPEEIPFRKEIELALWFHDTVYNPYGKDNEQKSADLASSFLKQAGASAETLQGVTNLILATRHTAKATSARVPPEASAEAQEQKIIMDIDLSILGSDPLDYDDYVRKIRKEYKLIPGPIFRKNRKAILEEFLNREPLFQTAVFEKKFEKQAKENLRRELENYR